MELKAPPFYATQWIFMHNFPAGESVGVGGRGHGGWGLRVRSKGREEGGHREAVSPAVSGFFL